MCELLIARGLTKRIVLTRLIVGHTHADIDGVFGRIWTKLRVRAEHLFLKKCEHRINNLHYIQRIVMLALI